MLEMLMQREQLMEDIIAIVDGELSGIISDRLSDELTTRLCDAVCKNFPTGDELQHFIDKIFTEDEIDAIYDAMVDFQDHGENQAEIARSVQFKLTEIFAEK